MFKPVSLRAGFDISHYREVAGWGLGQNPVLIQEKSNNYGHNMVAQTGVGAKVLQSKDLGMTLLRNKIHLRGWGARDQGARDHGGCSGARFFLVNGFCAAGLFLSGCVPFWAWAPIAEGTNYAMENKFLTEAWVSKLYDKDCSLSHIVSAGVLCRTFPSKVLAPVYCYPTIGRPECFAAPDPFNPGRSPIGGLAQQERQAEDYERQNVRLAPVPVPVLPVTLKDGQEDKDPAHENSARDDGGPVPNAQVPTQVPPEATNGKSEPVVPPPEEKNL